ncbi:MAG: MaoC family dehydratase N-terminal domain-containing protein [SAR324 cluster bacterium]|nr:MaoC family dehydratase N-terminal domain-containing protein [SAR324 cluster bacterium]
MDMRPDNSEHYPVISDAELEKLRQRIGVKIEKTLEPWVEEANRDAIRHYALGIGDDNPLWLDPRYAGNTRYGTLIAPPTFLFATNRIASGYVGGLPGIHAMFAGTDWRFLEPVRLGTTVRSEATLKDLIEHQTRFSGRAIQQIYHVEFFDQRGLKLAECDSWCFRTERATAREKGEKYKDVAARKVYSDEEMAEISAGYAKEQVRGGTPRYWEDVAEGDELPAILKGPMTVTGFIAYVQGWGGLYIRAHKLAFDTFRKHKGLGIPNAYNIPDVPERVHWEQEMARAVGAPDAYDYGPERISWMGHLMTNWIGDDGWLSRLHAKVVRHNPVGDLLTLSGRVVRKYEQEGRQLVDCELLAVNQDGEHSCEAEATAILPRRG